MIDRIEWGTTFTQAGGEIYISPSFAVWWEHNSIGIEVKFLVLEVTIVVKKGTEY